MNDSKVVRAGIGYTIGNILLKGLTFLTVPIFARLMSTEDFGIYNVFISYEGLFFVLIGCAIHSSYKNARYKFGVYGKDSDERNDYYSYTSNTLLFILCSSLLWVLFANTIAKLIMPVLKLDRVSLNLLLLYSSATAILTCYNTDLGIRYEYNRYIKLSTINAIANIDLSIILILFVFPNKRYLGRMIGTTLPVCCTSLYIVYTFLRRAKPSNSLLNLKWGIKYSIPIIPHGLSQIVLTQFDRIMIANMVGNYEAGIYSFSYIIFTILTVISTSIESVWSPYFYEQRKKNDTVEIRKFSNTIVYCMFFASCILILISPELVIVLGSNKYAESANLVAPIVASGYFAFLYYLPAVVEYYYEKTKFIAVGTSCAAVINVVLNYIFIHRFGYVAAAYTTLFTYMLYFSFHYYIYRKIEKERLYCTKSIVFTAIGILLIAAYTSFFIRKILFRGTFVIVFIIFGFIIFQRKFNLIKIIKAKRK